VHAVTSLDADRAGAADLARIARGQWTSNRHTSCATPPGPKTRTPATQPTGPRSWPTGNIAISLLRLAGIIKITRTIQAISRDRTRILNLILL
jgi:hypothetical protein